MIKKYTKSLLSNKHVYVVRDSVVSIPTCYGLDSARIESRLGRDFPRPSRPALGPTQPPIRWAPVLFPGR